jgi:hypothetical protein
MERWVKSVRERPEDASAALKSTLDLGISPERFLDALFPLLRDMWTFRLWGEKSFAGTSLSSDEKDFLMLEAPNWKPDVLKKTAMACASLFPRARMGLRNDVFSGLLLFEMLNAFDAEMPANLPEPPVSARPLPPPSLKTESVPEKKKPPRAEIVSIPPPESSVEGTKEILRLVAIDDLPIAAALIDVRIYRDGDLLKFDFAEAAKTAEVTLSNARAYDVLSWVLGLETADLPDEGETNGDGRPTGASAAMPGGGGAPTLTESISVRLGADILMSRRLDSEDADTGDIEDEQF